jgi:hypothetical protein
MTLLVTAEQGLGDMLQFIRLAAPIAERGVTVLVSAPAPLVSLLATAPGVTRVFGPDDPLPAFDAHAPLSHSRTRSRSKPRPFRPRSPYLAPDRQRRSTWKRSYPRMRASGKSGSPGRETGRTATTGADPFRSLR